ncbi:2-oxoadipate dioxygenase/decarboxylase family protein, partial [Stenotrophomonas sp. SrG]|uniref:2-oxoadipate dioxygenase/decarboxylase family protein n=1 Tax=Stenotrophomonas sp. SrG TaxID=3414430 RepID=UPI003CE7F6D1
RTASALAANPFRVFTSLLRLELIADEALRDESARILVRRRIFTDDARALIEQAEREGGRDQTDARRFVLAALETCR